MSLIAARRYSSCMHGSSSAGASGGVAHLVDRHPTVSPERLIAQLRPPPTFADVSFATYQPDPAEPTQAAAVVACQDFCRQAVERRAGRRKLLGRREILPGVGLYLDGGFGVGKTHLLASAYYQLPGDGPGGSPDGLGSQGVCDVRGADPAGRGVRLRRVHRPAGQLHRGLHRRIRTRRPGQHHADLAAALRRWSSAACRWPPPPTRCPSSSARAASRHRIFCAKSTRWQAFSRPCGSRARTTGTAVCRPRRSRCPTTRWLRAPRGSTARRSTISTRCVRTWPPCTRRGI